MSFINGELSNEICCNVGVRQGCSSKTPLFFSWLFINDLHYLGDKVPVISRLINKISLVYCMYADDVEIVTKSVSDL